MVPRAMAWYTPLVEPAQPSRSSTLVRVATRAPKPTVAFLLPFGQRALLPCGNAMNYRDVVDTILHA